MMRQTLIGEPQILPSGDMISPGFATDTLGAAFELKYHLSPAQAEWIEAWARQNLRPDNHGHDGFYRVASIYCDTPEFDVFHRRPGFKRRKYRVRRYGDSAKLFLERKTKKGDQVRKRRVEIADHEVEHLNDPMANPEWTGAWFHQNVWKRGFKPACQVSYERTAFIGQAGDSPVRMTFDRNLVGGPARDWRVAPIDRGVELLPGVVLLEMKYHIHMPELFQNLLPHLPAQPARMSKYRRCVESSGLAEPVVAPAADVELVPGS